MSEALEQRRGLLIIILLAVLTIVEFIFAIALDNTTALLATLAPMAVVKAALILWYFMHLPTVWRGEGGH